MGELKQKATTGALWSFLGSFGAQIVRFGIGIVLARILTPREYGLVGMLAIFIAIGDALVEGGFGQALIQKKNPTKKDYSSVFFLNLLVGVLLFFLLGALSPLIARFFEEDILSDLIVVLAFGIVIRSFMVIQNSIFIKQINFKAISIYRIISIAVSGLVAIPMAINGYGVWSLVGLTLTQNFTFTILLWFKSDWKPGFTLSFNSIKELFGFGSRILGISLLDNVFLNINKLVIGKYFLASDLGFYTRAYNYRDLVSKNILMVINSIVFPSFALFQDNLEKVKENYVKVSELAIFLTIPLLAALAFGAEPLIRFLITEKWLDTVPYLQILAIAGVFYPLSGVQVGILKAIGKANVYFGMILAHKIFIVLSIIVAIRWGVMGLVVAQVFNMFFIYSLGVAAMNKHLQTSIAKDLFMLIKYAALGLFVFFIAYFVAHYFFTKDLFVILCIGIIGFSLYYGTTSIMKLQGLKEFNQILNMHFLSKIKKNF